MTMLRRRGRKGPKPATGKSRVRDDFSRGKSSLTPLSPPAKRRRARAEGVVAEELKVRKTQEVVLVTGFEPFGGEKTNPSWDICRALPAQIAGMRVQTCRVPCEFRRSIEVVAKAIEQHRPLIVVSLGQGGGRTHLGVERVAINIDDARMPDNAGVQPLDETIAPNGPPAYFATLPVKAMAVAIRSAGAPAEVSYSAGTYVCNHLMYGVLHFIASSGYRARAGFIHVPFSEAQVLDKPGHPAMSIASMVNGVQAAIAAAREHPQDILSDEGTFS